MYDFIVLGIIPGTQLQITFLTWLLVASVVLCIFAIYVTVRSNEPTYRAPIRQQTQA
jgi:hypothetical protein